MNRNFVYVDRRQGGFEFGMDGRTPVTWTFSRGTRVPRRAYIAYDLRGSSIIDPIKLAAMPDTFVGSDQQLRAALRKGI